MNVPRKTCSSLRKRDIRSGLKLLNQADDVGRVSLNFQTSKATVYGCFTHIEGIPATTSLFRDSGSGPSPLITFRADVNFTSLPPNGVFPDGTPAVLPTLIQPGKWNIYFDTSSTVRNWNDPGSFSTGQVIGTLQRDLEQLAITGPMSTNAGATTLVSSSPFNLDGRTFDLSSFFQAVSDITSGSAVPVKDAQSPTTFAFAGYGIAAGK